MTKDLKAKSLGNGKWVLILFIVLPVSALIFWSALPDVAALKHQNPAKTAFMTYRLEHSKEKKRNPQVQTWVPLSRISPYLVKAVIIAEDSKCSHHEGFDYEGIQLAIEKDFKAKKLRAGGSTITQQLAKNLYLSPEKSVFRKLKEAAITLRLEQSLSKKRILELYLNVVEWGDGIYGAEAASRFYFSKTSNDLTPEEAARLVAVLPNPHLYNPAGDQKYVVKRSEMIYALMVKRGVVVPGYQEMVEPPVVGVPGAPGSAPVEAPRPPVPFPGGGSAVTPPLTSFPGTVILSGTQ